MESMNGWLAVLGALGGAGVGLFGGRLLGRRGVPAPPGWCAGFAAVLCALSVLPAGAPWWLAVRWCLSCFGVLLAAADLGSRRLPNVLTGAACCVLGLLLALAPVLGADAGVLGAAGVGVLFFGGAHLLVHLASPGGLGAGDVKLAVVLGAVLGVLGLPAVLLGGVLAFGLTASLAVGARLLGSRRWRDGVPHGPGLLLATWLLALLPWGVHQ